MLPTFAKLFLIGAALYGGLLLLMFVFQRSLVFGPSRVLTIPEDIGLPQVQVVKLLNSQGQELQCWWMAASAGRPTLLFTHGNAGGVADRAHKFEQLGAVGFGVFMVGYPGYGGNPGQPSEPGLVEAGLLAYDYLQAEGLAPRDLIFYGESLGSAVAVQVASQREGRAIVLESPMSSIREIAAGQYPFIPVRWLLRDPFLSIEHVSSVEEPLLVIHGSADDLIPIESGRKLFSGAPNAQVFHEVEGGGHNDLYDFPIVEVIQEFVAN